MPDSSRTRPLTLTGCGILRREIACLIRAHGWEAKLALLPSSLHVDLDRLERSLQAMLRRPPGRPLRVFYGTCHPLMDRFLEAAKVPRTAGQNCVSMLLGDERFTTHLTAGAFFLVEDWVRRWHQLMPRSCGGNLDVAYQLLREEHTHLLALRTPCSGDFTADAERIAGEVGLPLTWEQTSLDHLETALAPLFEDR